MHVAPPRGQLHASETTTTTAVGTSVEPPVWVRGDTTWTAAEPPWTHEALNQARLSADSGHVSCKRNRTAFNAAIIGKNVGPSVK